MKKPVIENDEQFGAAGDEIRDFFHSFLPAVAHYGGPESMMAFVAGVFGRIVADLSDSDWELMTCLPLKIIPKIDISTVPPDDIEPYKMMVEQVEFIRALSAYRDLVIKTKAELFLAGKMRKKGEA